jgi:dTDP-4-amino-4,6-dideoxygalactose transaminase
MNRDGHIPFVDLVTPHRELEDELVAVFRSALHTAGFIGGPMVEGFERDFAQFCETRLCVGVGSGTDALRFALMAAGVEPQSIVVTAPNTFIATTEAITQAGARPDFVDVDPATFTMDAEKLRHYLETQCDYDPQTRKAIHKKLDRPVTAVLPVHLYGQMADMDPILELAVRYNLTVIEDACQAHGAEYFSKKQNRWLKAGSVGHAAAFSFYPGKNLGACGEAGAVTTNSEEIASSIRMLRDHGQAKRYHHEVEGYNGRLDSIQAGILKIKLKHLTRWNEERRERARRYEEGFVESEGVILPVNPQSSRSVHHLYVIRVEDREGLKKHLANAGIDTAIHYPIPLHLQNAYASLGYKEGDFPVAEKLATEILSLPMYPQLDAAQQHRVMREVLQFTSNGVSPNSDSAVPGNTTAASKQLQPI